MNPDDYLDSVSRHITGSAAQKKRALDDLRDLLDSGISPDELGDPLEYAAMVSSDTEPKTGRYSRVWDPTNPRLFVPRVVGLGWDLNLGSLAVKLGWLRPDDIDSDVIGAVPDSAMRLSRSLPALGAALAMAAGAVAACRSDGSLPSSWDIAFRPTRYSSTVAALLPGIALSSGVALWAGLASNRSDQIARAVFASSASSVGAGITIMAARSTWSGGRPQPLTGIASAVVAPVALSLLAGLVPIRAGLKNIWQEAGLRVQH